MFRWEQVETQELQDAEVKMYRDPYVPSESINIPSTEIELDDVAFQFLESELFLYKILDSNFVNFIEARGKVYDLDKLIIPSQTEDEGVL